MGVSYARSTPVLVLAAWDVQLAKLLGAIGRATDTAVWFEHRGVYWHEREKSNSNIFDDFQRKDGSSRQNLVIRAQRNLLTRAGRAEVKWV